MNSMLQLLRESLFAAGSIVVFEIKSNELGPWQVFFGRGRMYVWLKIGEVVLGRV
jgi:hypothetical protein